MKVVSDRFISYGHCLHLCVTQAASVGKNSQRIAFQRLGRENIHLHHGKMPDLLAHVIPLLTLNLPYGCPPRPIDTIFRGAWYLSQGNWRRLTEQETELL
jgi:hypothetical protein